MESIFKLGILLSVIDKVSNPALKMGQGMDKLRGKVASLGPAFDKFKTYGLRVATVGALMLHMLSGTVMATVDTQKALGELSSVGIKNLAALESAGARFSGQWAGTTKAQFISSAYDIKSGISSLTDTGVAEYTRMAALTGKATKSTTAEMTSLFATGYGIYKDMYGKLSDIQFGEVFSAGIAGAVKTFKTTGSGMAQAISTLGATATTSNVPLEEQLTILGMLQATMKGAEAGTKYKAVMQSAAQAGAKLELSFMNANNQLLSMPEILMKLKGKYGDTLDAMEKMEIQKAFGREEAVAVIDLLYGKVGALTKNIKGLSAVMKQGTGFTGQMARAMNQDIGSGIALLGQRFHNLVEVIGKQLIPVLTPLFSLIGNIINRFIQFAEKHKYLTSVAVIGVGVIAVLAFTLGTLAAVLGVVGLMFPNVIMGFKQVGTAASFMKKHIFSAINALKTWIVALYSSLKASITAGVGGLKAFASTIIKTVIPAIWAWGKSMITSLIPPLGAAIAAVWSFTAALLANPITWIAIAVVALGAAMYVLYKKSETVRNAVKAVGDVLGHLWNILVSAGKAAWNALIDPIGFVTSLFHRAEKSISSLIGRFGGVGPALKALARLIVSFVFPPLAIAFHWDEIKKGVYAALDFLKGIWTMFKEAGAGLWEALTAGIKSKIAAPVETVKKGLSFIRNLLPFSDAKEGPLSTLAHSGAQLINTLASGVESTAPALKNAVAASVAGAMLATASPAISMPVNQPASVTVPVNQPVPVTVPVSQPAPVSVPVMQSITPPEIPEGGIFDRKTEKGVGLAERIRPVEGKKTIITIHNLNLPNVTDADSFVDQLKRLVEGNNV